MRRRVARSGGFWVALLMAATCVASPPALIRGRLGEGYTLADQLWVAGDVTLVVLAPDHGPTSGEIDDASLLLRWEPTPRLSFFNETRIAETLSAVEGQGLQTGSGDIEIERLYGEWLVTPHLTVRGGKFLTPIGLWNEVRRAPLTWTVERPAATDMLFPEHATGLDLIYLTTWRGWTIDATAYGPAQNTLTFRGPDEDDTLLDRESGRLAGGRVSVGRTLGPAYAALGVYGAGFTAGEPRFWAKLAGADLELSLGGHTVTGEFNYTTIPSRYGHSPYGFYLQDVVPIPIPTIHELYGVARLEFFQPEEGRSSTGGVVGLFWRPVPFLVLKANYTFASRALDNLEPGFLASISLLF